MNWHYRPTWKAIRWISLLGAPVLSLIAFVLTYWLDPLKFGTHQPLSALPAFLLSIIILIIGQTIRSGIELEHASTYSRKTYEAIKRYLHVTPIGSPEEAFRYINGRIPVLREVQNTSFSIDDESERADEKLYETEVYEKTCQELAYHCCKTLIWKDVGDRLAIKRLRSTRDLCNTISKGRKYGYRFKLISHNEPQMNFIILEYNDGTREVLFNWDFRGNGQDPTVLISRDQQMVEMFAIHFTLLWRRASEDHDSQATNSTSAT
jgi:hypothetical protein